MDEGCFIFSGFGEVEGWILEGQEEWGNVFWCYFVGRVMLFVFGDCCVQVMFDDDGWGCVVGFVFGCGVFEVCIVVLFLLVEQVWWSFDFEVFVLMLYEQLCDEVVVVWGCLFGCIMIFLFLVVVVFF